MSNSTLPQTGFVRLPVVLQVIPVGKSTWWAGVKTGRFPKPVKFGRRISVWRVEDIQALISQMVAQSPINGEKAHAE